ncbi:MAG TPA: efflux RND transporter periplasmic adaptor subunit [Candidatus Paceibacterota bacterium]
MPSLTELLSHTAVRIALAVAAVMLVASAAYYFIESRPPAYAFATAAVGAVTDDVTGTGTVSPVQNPDIAFAAGGRVTYVGVKVGDTVTQGQLLASLDTGVLSANLASAQARLAGLVNGPRAVDVAGQQTGVDQAKQTLANTYASLPATIASDAASAEAAVHNTDYLFGSLNAVDHPHVGFVAGDSGAAEQAGIDRGNLKAELDAWDREVSDLNANPSESAADAELAKSIAHLNDIRDFFAQLTQAANSAHPALSADDTSAVSAGYATVNGLIVSLTGQKQGLASQKLAVQSAEDALALTQAGATPEDRQAAQAAVDAAAATLAQSQAVAPFSGTVASVAVKAGDVVAPNTTAVALIPAGNFEVDIYLSEIDVTKVHAGDAATVTLDAYGAAAPFNAAVSSVDRAPTPVNGIPSYKATLVFAESDPRIAAGMHANARVHAAAKSGVLTVPTAAVDTDAQGAYVLKKEGGGTMKTRVETGIRGTESVEIVSGLAAGDQVALITGQ